MPRPHITARLIPLVLVAFSTLTSVSIASQVLVVDRLTNSVYNYTTSGQLIGTVLSDPVNLDQPDGIVVSPDKTKLFVASSQNSQIVEYDYDRLAGTATNPTVFANAKNNGLAFPNSMVFSDDGSTLYVANLGGTGITQLDSTGKTTGTIGGGSSFAFSGLAFAPTGELLAGGFDGGTVAKSNAAFTSLSDFIGPSALLAGAAGVMVDGNDLYVTGLFTGELLKFNAKTGASDASFVPPTPTLAFPQGILASPDGNGILVGILGKAPGSGNITKYSTSGTEVGIWADHSANGFHEATAFITVVPEPSSFALAGLGVALAGLIARRRRNFGR